MTKRRIVGVAVAVCLALLTCAAMGRLTQPHPVNRLNFERIRVGMTRAEVETILGCPPGVYSTKLDLVSCYSNPASLFGARWEVGDSAFLSSPGEPEKETEWYSDYGAGLVWFDVKGGVKYATFIELLPKKQPSLLDRLRTWLGW